ncbi:MAG: hypothetical protein V1725_06875 [archaeon]
MRPAIVLALGCTAVLISFSTYSPNLRENQQETPQDSVQTIPQDLSYEYIHNPDFCPDYTIEVGSKNVLYVDATIILGDYADGKTAFVQGYITGYKTFEDGNGNAVSELECIVNKQEQDSIMVVIKEMGYDDVLYITPFNHVKTKEERLRVYKRRTPDDIKHFETVRRTYA